MRLLRLIRLYKFARLMCAGTLTTIILTLTILSDLTSAQYGCSVYALFACTYPLLAQLSIQKHDASAYLPSNTGSRTEILPENANLQETINSVQLVLHTRTVWPRCNFSCQTLAVWSVIVTCVLL